MVQTERAVDDLRRANPALGFEIRTITTSGDKDQTSFLSTLRNTQFFTKELDDAMLAGDIDIAVHSLKDIVLELPEGIDLAAALERDEYRDALVSRDGSGLKDLPQGAVIGTGSVRRRAFLRRVRPDVSFSEIRGNLNTRMRVSSTPSCWPGAACSVWAGAIGSPSCSEKTSSCPRPGRAPLP